MGAREQHVSRMQLDVKDEGDLGFSVRTADHPFVGGVGCGNASAGLSVHAGDMRGDPSIRRMGSDWVIFSGVIQAPITGSPLPSQTVALTVPGVYRPERTNFSLPSAIGDTANSTSAYGLNQMQLNTTTGR